MASRAFIDVQFVSYFVGEFKALDIFSIDFNVWGMAISGNIAVIGSPGVVFTFEKNTQGIWNQTMHIVPTNISQGALFGFSVDIENNDNDYLIVVGAYHDQEDGSGGLLLFFGETKLCG